MCCVELLGTKASSDRNHVDSPRFQGPKRHLQHLAHPFSAQSLLFRAQTLIFRVQTSLL